MKTEIILRTNIEKSSSNGGLQQQILFSLIDEENNKKHNFKIQIRTDSVEHQSYAKLLAWTGNNGFEIVISRTLVEAYNQNPTYDSPSSVKVFFDKVEKDLISLAKKFV